MHINTAFRLTRYAIKVVSLYLKRTKCFLENDKSHVPPNTQALPRSSLSLSSVVDKNGAEDNACLCGTITFTLETRISMLSDERDTDGHDKYSFLAKHEFNLSP